jgi:hypothetical protein
MNYPCKLLIPAYTDYPLIEFGDIGGEEAPIRECTIVGYDGDKYCTVLVDGLSTAVKKGYLYKESGRCGEVDSFSHDELYHLQRSTL